MVKLIKKFTALVLALSISFSIGIFDVVISAASSSVSINYQSFGYNMGGSGLGAYFGQFIYLSVGEKIGYCLEISKNASSSSYTVNDGSQYDSCISDLGLSAAQGNNLKYALVHGYQGTSKYGYNDTEERVATQIIVWAIVNGWFDSTTTGITSKELTAIKYLTGELKGTSSFSSTNYPSLNDSGQGTYANVKSCYALIKKNIINFSKKPSFDGDTIELAFNPSTSKYTATITDANATAMLYNWENAVADISGLSVDVINSQKIILTSTVALDDEILNIEKVKGYGYSDSATISNIDVAYLEASNGSEQDVLSPFGADDPVDTSLTLKTSKAPEGNLYIIKTSEDGNISGVKFIVEGGDGSSLEITTNSAGVAVASNLPVEDGEGNPITYTVSEAMPGDIYVPVSAQTVILEEDVTKVLNFENVLKKWQLSATKRDSETGSAQGDATLEGAVYGLYQNGTLVDTFTTDSNGSFISSYYPCGNNYTLKEISPSTGYQLDNTTYSLTGTSGDQLTLEFTTLSKTVTEQVVKGKIAITKHTDDGSTQIETPETGAEFDIYLKNAGSYASTPSNAKDHIVCDSFGYAESKSLPYGIYTVSQTYAWPGREKIADFDVFISSNGMTYRYLINNANFESYLKIEKLDAETGEIVPCSDTGFQIYNPAGELVTMYYTYPTLTAIDTFYTSSSGYLITPEKLPYGIGYTLVEVAAPNGYTINSTPVTFDVTPENSTYEQAQTVVLVQLSDSPQKGYISITKYGEVFSGVSFDGQTYQPLYETRCHAGTVYEIYAAEDIYTPDGTKRYSVGEVVDTITTGSTGSASSKALYLGTYHIREVKAPYGLTLDSASQSVTLAYQGQGVSSFSVPRSQTNERPRLSVTINKTMEQDIKFQAGSDTDGVSFGLFANEEIRAADGSVIPADALIEIVNMEGETSATIQSDLPFGKYYLKELETAKGYILSDTKYEFEFKYEGETVKLVEIAIEAENKLGRGEIEGVKVTEDGLPLGKAKIGLFFSEGVKEYTEDTAIATVITNEDGSFSFKNVPYGTYVVKELEAPSEFELNNENFVITVNETTSGVEITNDYIKGSIVINKIDSITSESLDGAIFEVFKDDGDEIFNIEKDISVGTMTSSGDGIYSMNDLRIGSYFVKEIKAPEEYFIDENVYFVKITNKGDYVVTNSEDGFANRPMADIGDPNSPKNPGTGTTSNFGNLSLTIIACSLIIALAFFSKRKEEK